MAVSDNAFGTQVCTHRTSSTRQGKGQQRTQQQSLEKHSHTMPWQHRYLEGEVRSVKTKEMRVQGSSRVHDTEESASKGTKAQEWDNCSLGPNMIRSEKDARLLTRCSCLFQERSGFRDVQRIAKGGKKKRA